VNDPVLPGLAHGTVQLAEWTPRWTELFAEEAARLRFTIRDALRAEPALRERYAELKRELALTYGTERGRYTEGKSAFVEHVLRTYRDASAEQTQ
jgi:GrpB-like predicted nucleotidyltransferase (UPF0157 family)